jgi:hypothetical protein
MVISARYDHILRIETLHFLILLQVESTQHTQKVKACDLVCLTRDAIRVLLEKKKKVSLPLLLLLKEKKCLLIICMIMREHYFYDHEREREQSITYQANIQFIGGRPPDTCGRMMTIASKPNGSFISFSFASFFHALYNFFYVSNYEVVKRLHVENVKMDFSCATILD